MATKRQPRSTRRKPTGAMAAVLEPRKSSTVLIGDLRQHAVKKALEDDSRRQDVIHPSEMAKEDWCPRQTTYRIRGIEPSDSGEVHGYRMLTIFQEGHDVHTKWQTWLGEMGRLWGKWRCPACSHTILYTGQPTCPLCAKSDGLLVPMAYAEVPLDATERWLIEGHADGGVPDISSFIEVKTIGLGTIRMEEPALVRKHTVKTTEGKSVVDYDSLWKGVNRPFKSHRRQAAIYLAIANLLGWDYDQMVFIYENKANQDTKEFVVPFDAELAEGLIDTAKDIKWAVEQNIDLPRPEGLTKDKKPCKECPWRTWCWAGEEEPDEQAGQPEPDASDGARVPRSQAKARPAAHRDADPAGQRVPRTARRPDRVDRQRTDEVVRGADEVGGVPEHPTRGGGGRRVVRRRVSGAGQGDQDAVEHDRDGRRSRRSEP